MKVCVRHFYPYFYSNPIVTRYFNIKYFKHLLSLNTHKKQHSNLIEIYFLFIISHMYIILFAANAVSLIPWVPAEILSAKLAIQDRKGAIGMNEMIAQIYRKEGIFGFFKGFFSSLAVHVTYSFLWWVSYSTTRRQVEVFFPTLQRDNLLFYDAITGKKKNLFYSLFINFVYFR